MRPSHCDHGECPMSSLSERDAAMAWTRICEGEDVRAYQLIEERGYAGALEWLRAPKKRSDWGEYAQVAERWAGRISDDAFQRDRRTMQGLGGFLIPSDPNWPQSLEDLGERRPLGLWYRGDVTALASPSIAIVGTRDASQYGSRVATDFAFELAKMGVVIVSGGAFGIDAAAHRGALQAQGRTIAVLAGGIDRPYPLRNENLFSAMLNGGGLLLSEVPPGASPHRHRFLARNRIIAGITRATVVAEAPYRSGAINTARHALEIGHEVGAIPGPLTSVRSAGCHRLLRENATCITTAAEAAELLGYTSIANGVQGALDVVYRRGPTNNPLSLRVQDALPVTHAATLQKIAATAGLSAQETMRGLGNLEMEGIAESVGGKWRLAKRSA
ncbi:DNA-protecting protein DprA [Ancrocorticia populi]|uniref:DNA-protecting protein DprA n=2 Tax=Ancrocorticia populi TaxID=2175228 RepID=A0A2V1K8A5_9ACTO|nr:DNA-protecting protein DprA [Ancrocorticia populi]